MLRKALYEEATASSGRASLIMELLRASCEPDSAEHAMRMRHGGWNPKARQGDYYGKDSIYSNPHEWWEHDWSRSKHWFHLRSDEQNKHSAARFRRRSL